MNFIWTPQRLAFLRKKWPVYKPAFIADLLGCRAETVIQRANGLGLPMPDVPKRHRQYIPELGAERYIPCPPAT